MVCYTNLAEALYTLVLKLVRFQCIHTQASSPRSGLFATKWMVNMSEHKMYFHKLPAWEFGISIHQIYIKRHTQKKQKNKTKSLYNADEHPVAYFTKAVNPHLAKPPLTFNGG